MKRKLRVAGTITDVEVDAFVYGHWAATRAFGFDADESSWTITHVPTGMRLPFETTGPLCQKQARRLARAIGARLGTLLPDTVERILAEQWNYVAQAVVAEALESA